MVSQPSIEVDTHTHTQILTRNAQTLLHTYIRARKYSVSWFQERKVQTSHIKIRNARGCIFAIHIVLYHVYADCIIPSLYPWSTLIKQSREIYFVSVSSTPTKPSSRSQDTNKNGEFMGNGWNFHNAITV